MGYDRIVADDFGGPEVLRIGRVAALPRPGPGEVLLRVEAAGVGYTDTILRRGRYAAYTGGLPLTPGYDVVGTATAIGAGVTGIAAGARYADMPVSGGYAQYLVRPAAGLVPVPAGLDAGLAVEVPLMWVTAWQMLTRMAPAPAGAAVLVVGASGAVGRALVALGRHLGLTVIGTASAANLALVEALGAVAIDYRRADLVAAIRAAGGDAVVAAFDAVGGESWETSWASLGQAGVLVGYGFQGFLESNGPAGEAARWMARFAEMTGQGDADGSGRRTTFYDIRERRGAHPADWRADAARLLDLIATGAVVPPPPERLRLDQAAEAHRRIAAGGLDRRLVLAPWMSDPGP